MVRIVTPSQFLGEFYTSLPGHLSSSAMLPSTTADRLELVIIIHSPRRQQGSVRRRGCTLLAFTLMSSP